MQRGTANRLPPMASLYPDVLGFISSGARLTVECVQVALGVYPKRVAVGQPFELLILLQNICDHLDFIQIKRHSKGHQSSREGQVRELE